MDIANTILSGLKFAAGGDDEHTARVAQSQQNQIQQRDLDKGSAQQLMEEFYASGIDIAPDGRGMNVNANELLNDDAGRQRLVRLWNSERAAGNFKDKNGNRISTEIVDFQTGPDSSVIPMVKGHNGQIVPMTELRSDRDDDKVLQLDADRFSNWSNELYKNNIARAGGSFIFGGNMGKIDAVRARAFEVGGAQGAVNNAAIEGITQMTGGDPEATSAGLAIIADADADGTSQIAQEMGIDVENVIGTFIQDRPVEAENLALPSGTPGTAQVEDVDALPSAPSRKPSRAIDIAAPEIERRNNLVNNISANLLDRSNVREQLRAARKTPTKGSAALKAQKRDKIASLEAREKELTAMIREGEQIRDSGNMAPLEGEDKLAGNREERRRDRPKYDTEADLRRAGVPPDLLGQARRFVNNLGITKEGVELDEARRKATREGDMVALDRLIGRNVEDIDPADVQAVLNNSTGPVSPTQVREDLQRGVQPTKDELDSVRTSMQSNNITDVRQLRQAKLDEALAAARVIAMMADGDMTAKTELYANLVNYVQTGNFGTTPNDIAQTQVNTAKEQRLRNEAANKPRMEATNRFRDSMDKVRETFATDLYYTDKTGKEGRTWKGPSGAGRQQFDFLMEEMRTFDNHFRAGRISPEEFTLMSEEALRLAGQFILADASSRDTSMFNFPAAFRDFFSNSETTANAWERMVIKNPNSKSRDLMLQIVRPNGNPVDGEVSLRSITRTMPQSMAKQLETMLRANTERIYEDR